jgi:CspA family cold shock protein
VQGTVKRFFPDRGFGFLTPDDNSPDIFCHAADLAKSGLVSLRVGERVEFDTGPGTKGPRAIGIKLLDA